MIRVFIISSHLMFSRGLESLLHQHTAVDIVGREADVEQAIGQVKLLQPDVVILDSDAPPPNFTMTAMRILRERLETRVIGLSLQHNNIYTYQVRQQIARSVQDLIEAIKRDNSSFALVNLKDAPRR